ncbi:MAG TPA: NADPH:quinone oxidoreductase family protein, partial [Chloroflexota bacterium]|nr:NADPH:quinone oxidoreductase family protein [Chloroflexota bacterium]
LAQRKGAYMTPTRLPLTLGMEVAGMIEAVGPGVTSPAVGTRLAALVGGGYAEYAVTAAGGVIPIPADLDFAHAAAFPLQGLTAYQLLQESARLQAGESVLVHAAAGGVGTLAVQLAKLMGAGTVIGTASTEEKLDLARELGADVGINYTEDGWVERVREATDGKGVHIVLEMVGGRIAQQSLQCLLPFDGRMVVFGAASGELAQFSGRELMDRNIAVLGYWLSPWIGRPEAIGRATQALMGYLATDKLRIIVGHTYPLAEAAAAHQAMAARKTTGKVVLLVA